MKTCTFGPNTQKFSLKKVLILFPKKTRLGKILLYFLKRKLFLYFQKWTLHFSAQVKKKKKKKKGTTLRKLLTLQETEAPKKAFLVFQETSYISGSNFLWLKIKIFHALPHVEAKLSRLKYFFIIIIKHFFSFCNTFFYTQQSFAFHLLRAFYNIHDHIMAFFSFSSFEKF